MAETVAEALREAQVQLGRMDGRWLLQQVTGLDHAGLIAQDARLLTAAESAALQALIARRAAGEPLAYLLGWMDFRGRRFAVTPDVLVPRPETEELIDLAIAKLAGLAHAQVLDLGTGSGAIAVSLAGECPQAQVAAIDVSPKALAVARGNAQMLGTTVRFYEGSWLAPLPADARFHLIVSNPPYIRADDPHLVGDGVCYEPRLALTDEGDGLDCIRAIVSAAPAHLHRAGWLMFEHGYDQGLASRNLLAAAGFQAVFTQQDFSGHDRISGGQYFDEE